MKLPEEKIEEHIQHLESRAMRLRTGMERHTHNAEGLKAESDPVMRHFGAAEEAVTDEISNHHDSLNQTIFFLKSLLDE